MIPVVSAVFAILVVGVLIWFIVRRRSVSVPIGWRAEAAGFNRKWF